MPTVGGETSVGGDGGERLTSSATPTGRLSVSRVRPGLYRLGERTPTS
jgi:hypothetical protein